MGRPNQKKPSWSDLKRQLAELDRAALLGLIRDMYAARKDNQAFLHARFALGNDVLKPYKATIARWVCPDVVRDQGVSIAKAKRAILDYKKAVGQPEGMAELTVFYCESCTSLISCFGMDDERYFDALVRMFRQALEAIQALAPSQQGPFVDRLEMVRRAGQNWGWGVGDEMNYLMDEYALAEE